MGTTENKKSGRTVHHKICEQCGKPFDTIYKANRFCCSTCGSRHYAETQKKERTCAYCGKKFWKPNGHKIKYCSKECREAAIASRRKPPKEKSEPKLYKKICKHCGKEFETKYSHQIYCSRECGYAATLKQKRDEWADQHVTQVRVCKECGAVFATKCGDTRKQFCCKACADKNERRKEHATTRHKEYNKRYRKQRDQQLKDQFVEDVSYEDIYERDEGICQICGLPVHPVKGIDNNWDGTIDHIIPLSKGGDHSMANCQLSHRICNSLKGQIKGSYSIDWYEKITEGNYWRLKFMRELELIEAMKKLSGQRNIAIATDEAAPVSISTTL